LALELIPFVQTKRRRKHAIEREARPTSELNTEIPRVKRSLLMEKEEGRP
jgi:hypothetical protein